MVAEDPHADDDGDRGQDQRFHHAAQQDACRNPRCSELSSITAGGISVRAVRAFAGTRVAQMLQLRAGR